jgi:hypothetical protein
MSQSTSQRLKAYIWNAKTRGQFVRYIVIGVIASGATAFFGAMSDDFVKLWILNGSVGAAEFLIRKWYVFRA